MAKASGNKPRTQKQIDADKRRADREKEKKDRAQKKEDLKAANKKVAGLRKELGFKKQELRGGMKLARTTYREGNKGCRTTRRAADAPHRDGLRRNKVDFEACKDAVQTKTWGLIGEHVLPPQAEVARLSRLVPPPVPNPRNVRNQELWGERLDQARAEITQAHPELAAHIDTLLGPVGRAGSKAARELRAQTDRLVNGRPALSLAEYIAQRAVDAGWASGEGIAGGAPSLQRAAESAAARSVRTLMEAGPPADVLARFGPSSATPPSHVAPSALAFPPPSGRTSLDTLIDPLFTAGASPRSGSAVEEILAASRRVPPSRRPARRPRAATAARGQGPRTRAPKTQASPGSSPPPKKERKPRQPRVKKEA